jgi:cytidylate kinase
MVQPIGKNIRGITAVVERQIRNWEIVREQGHRVKNKGTSPLKFYLTISRESGCNGDAIADKIAQKTGFQKYGKELLDHMVTESDIRREIYETLDDKTVGWIESIISAISFGPSVGQEEYFHRLCHAVLTICYNTHAIILGRGANNILPRNCGLNVRLVAPMEFRIKNYAELKGVDPKVAGKELRAIDKQQGGFVENYFGRYAYDPRRFDLIVNVAHLPQDRIADMIIGAMKVKAGPDLVLPLPQKKNNHVPVKIPERRKATGINPEDASFLS